MSWRIACVLRALSALSPRVRAGAWARTRCAIARGGKCLALCLLLLRQRRERERALTFASLCSRGGENVHCPLPSFSRARGRELRPLLSSSREEEKASPSAFLFSREEETCLTSAPLFYSAGEIILTPAFLCRGRWREPCPLPSPARERKKPCPLPSSSRKEEERALRSAFLFHRARRKEPCRLPSYSRQWRREPCPLPSSSCERGPLTSSCTQRRDSFALCFSSRERRRALPR